MSIRSERREQIVTALGALMQERSYARSTIQAIAERAGVRSGIVHYYFPCKLAILEALVERVEGRFRQRVEQERARCDTEADAWISAMLGLRDPDPGAVKLWVQLSAQALDQPVILEVWQGVLERQRLALREAIAGLAEAENTPPERVDVAVASLQAFVAGSFQLWANGASLPEGFAADAARRLIRGML